MTRAYTCMTRADRADEKLGCACVCFDNFIWKPHHHQPHAGGAEAQDPLGRVDGVQEQGLRRQRLV